jgi:hypothetical protein
VDLRGPIVIVTGSEGRGLNARVRKRVDLMARIPMRGKVASLNASVAGSVFLFEAATQRDLPESSPAVAVEAGTGHETPMREAIDRSPDPGPRPEADPTLAAGTEGPELTAEVVSEADELLPEAPPPATDEPR